MALLTSVRLGRLASAFELSEHEVLADARAIVDWTGSAAALDAWLNARHAWYSDEAHYFVRWVRHEVWLSRHQLP